VCVCVCVFTHNIFMLLISRHKQNLVSEPVFRSYGKISSKTTAQKVTDDTAFMLASVSKVFTASAVMSLINNGIISSLDDDICNVINHSSSTEQKSSSSSACRNPLFPNTVVTWRMLVTHRSSLLEDIPEVINFDGDEVLPSYGPTGAYEGLADGNPSCPLDDVKQFYQDLLTDKETETTVGSTLLTEDGESLNWYDAAKTAGGPWYKYRPGAKRRYSNLAAGYVAALVEHATGQSFEEFTQEQIFIPLGMSKTSWFQNLLPPDTTLTLPITFKNGKFKDEEHYCYIDFSSGQLYSTTKDLSLFLNEMLTYGSPALWEESFSLGKSALQCQERNAKGAAIPLAQCEFGIGWAILNNAMKGDESWRTPLHRYDWTNGGEHDGSELGVQTQILVLPTAGVYLAVLTNTDGNNDNAAQYLAQVFVREIQLNPPTMV
jgi:CubicO group peptidase (beta-lactamase class C family)